jgi:orotate phosphoribosyltransferase
VLKTHQIEFLELMLESEALRFGDFTLKSGRRSPYFVNTGCFHTGRTTERLAECYVGRLVDLVEEGLEFDVVFGPAYKGIPLCVAIATAWHRRTGRDVGWCFDRKEAKDHGDRGRLVGAPIQGRRILLVDDVLTAGTSMRAALDIIDDVPDARAVAALISVDREEVGRGGTLAATKELEAERGLPVHSIVGIRDAVRHLHENDVGGRRHVDDGTLARMQEYWKQHGAPTQEG